MLSFQGPSAHNPNIWDTTNTISLYIGILISKCACKGVPLNSILGVRIRIMPRTRYTVYWKNSMNNHVIKKGVDVEVMKVIQLASEVHN